MGEFFPNAISCWDESHCVVVAEGAQKQVAFTTRRTAYSCFGTVRSLTGRPVSGVRVVATDTAAKEDPDEQADKLAKKAKTPDEIDEEHAKLKENLTRAIPRQRQPTRKSLAAAEKRVRAAESSSRRTKRLRSLASGDIS